MAIKVGINGYGRIGRNILRALYEAKRTGEIQIVAINDLGDANTNAHLTRYDTAHGKFPGEVKVDGDSHGRQRRSHQGARASAIRRKLPWGELGVDTVLECTGLFTSKAKASAHLKGGAKKRDHLRAGRRRRRRHHRLRREPRRAQEGAHRHLERFVHHQLPGAAGQGAARQDRHRSRRHDHDPCVHQRSGADRRVSLGPAPRALGDHVADSRPRPAPPRRWAWCCRSSRASSTASRSACRPSTCRWST